MSARHFAASARPSPPRAAGFPLDFLRGEARAARFLPRHPSRPADFDARVAELAGRAPAGGVWARAGAAAAHLGAGAASIESAQRLAGGEALCVVTGQQPGLFLGPLYAIYKAMTAVRLAAWVSARTGRPVVPVFWVAADDSDFAEIASTYLPVEDFRLERNTLGGGTLPAGGMVGDLAASETKEALEACRTAWRGRVGGDELTRGIERACERAGDHGEIAAALVYDWLGASGIVVVDGRWAELRRAAQGLFARWADRRSEVEAACLAAGRSLEEAGYRAPLSEASVRTGLFDISGGRRLPFEGGAAALRARIDSSPETLSPNVVLRPVVQDALFPNVATVAGPSEIAYHAQLIPVYERLEVTAPVLVPRFEATLVPGGVVDLAARREAPLEEFVADFDAALKSTAARAVPAALGRAVESFDRAALGELGRLRDAARAFDPKLGEALVETERRLAETVERVRERIADAARAAERRRDPALRNYKEFLSPFRLPQERVLSAATLLLEGGRGVFARFDELVDRHLDAVRAGSPVHWLVELDALAAAAASPELGGP